MQYFLLASHQLVVFLSKNITLGISHFKTLRPCIPTRKTYVQWNPGIKDHPGQSGLNSEVVLTFKQYSTGVQLLVTQHSVLILGWSCFHDCFKVDFHCVVCHVCQNIIQGSLTYKGNLSNKDRIIWQQVL